MSVDHPNYYIIKIDQNTEKSPEDLKRLAVTQTSAKVNADVNNSQGDKENTDRI